MLRSRSSASPLSANKKSQTPINISVWQLKRDTASQIDLSGFDNFSGLDAAGADFHSSVASGR